MVAFDRWLVGSVEERAEQLTALEADDPALCARLRTMIAADAAAEAQDFLAAPGAMSPPTPAQRSGQRLGAWTLQERVGSGGMGEVWRATRSDGLYRGDAAVKLLHRSDAATAARFVREGELLARLVHPHVAQLLDAGTADDASHYLVLEFVRGQRIDEWCDTQRLDVDARLRLLLQVCEAVAFAHAHLVVHRDLKPANILVTDEGHVKLLDFGVAKLLATDPLAADLTRLGGAGLTLEYAAPEQAAGGVVSTATDVYALGVLMYRLLSGTRPYGSATHTPAQWAREIAETEPAPLGQLAAHELAAAAAQRSSTPQRLQRRLRGDVAHIVAKALRKAAGERYVSGQALADDIARHLRGEPVAARRATLAYRGRRWALRHRAWVAAAAVLLLALALGAAWAEAGIAAVLVAGCVATLWQAQRARAQAVRAQNEADKANAITEFVLGVFNTTKVGDGDIAARQQRTARQLLEAGGEQLLAETSLPPPVRLALLSTLGRLHFDLNLLASAEALETEALRVARSLHGAGSAACIDASVALAATHAVLGRPQEQQRLLHEAIAMSEATGQQHLASRAVALHRLGTAAMHAGDLDTATTWLQRSVAAFAEHHPQHEGHRTARRWLGQVHTAREDFDSAQACFEQLLALLPQRPLMPAHNSYDAASVHYALGDLALACGRFADAATAYGQAVAAYAATLAADAPALGAARTQLARVLHELGQDAAAQAQLALAFDSARADPSLQPGNLADRARLVATVIGHAEGRSAEVLADAQALAPRLAALGPLPGLRAAVLLAEITSANGAHAQAEELLQPVLPLLETATDAGSLVQRQLLVACGEVHEKAGRHADASAAYARALSSHTRPGAEALPTARWVRARALLGRARLALDADAKAAHRDAEAALALLPADSPVRREQALRLQAAALLANHAAR